MRLLQAFATQIERLDQGGISCKAGSLRVDFKGPAAVSGTIVPVPAHTHAPHRTHCNVDRSDTGRVCRWLVVIPCKSLAWDDQPQVPMGTPAGQVPEPFRRLTITDRHPTEPRAHYALEERALLCEVCEVPEIHWPTHRAGLLHHERARATRGVGTQQAPAAHVPHDADLDAALNLLHRLRPHLL
ncbi:hypothetical protein IscW_ISCW004672 [Ixodes scapularis]|uniref:Uncharacterized protein n=1 Tax=Ixodes scapularis TaxID=6945 RepID=B7PI56_IXOSC|nr:hypothetical protein IscW_ISCW004672 [Ixodes scapularis]|eukprot:XP_002404421.1 hypothetical protein IscW_ISCW004672 [Ixodes scapularis]